MLCLKIKEFKFICYSIIIKHDLFDGINPVSKVLQDENMNIPLVVRSIDNLKAYISEYRSNENIDKKDLRKHCDDLEIILKNGNNKDINAIKLFDAVILFKDSSSANNWSFPNFAIALRILLTIPVSVRIRVALCKI